MRIEHLAVWTGDLERLRAFHERWFGARAGARYESATRRGFVSYFLTFPDGGARLEIMSLRTLEEAARPPARGYAHVAISVGSRERVDALVREMTADGVALVSAPRTTGDGYYEAVVEDPDGNLVEITV
jgi:lactoylglutathione lyase